MVRLLLYSVRVCVRPKSTDVDAGGKGRGKEQR